MKTKGKNENPVPWAAERNLQEEMELGVRGSLGEPEVVSVHWLSVPMKPRVLLTLLGPESTAWTPGPHRQHAHSLSPPWSGHFPAVLLSTSRPQFPAQESHPCLLSHHEDENLEEGLTLSLSLRLANSMCFRPPRV